MKGDAWNGLRTPTSKATRKCVSGTLVKGMSIVVVGNNTAACKDSNGVETPSGWCNAVHDASACRWVSPRSKNERINSVHYGCGMKIHLSGIGASHISRVCIIGAKVASGS